tara:strand:+ start:16150 stop:16707 length:558 start_codon:yes stop_codon:yes gene_type:complete
MIRKIKEEYAIVLDFLPHGYPDDTRPMHRKTPIAQAMGKGHFVLLELIPKKGQFLQPYEEVYLGEGKRDKIHHILGRLSLDKLTQTAKHEIDFVVDDLVKKKEAEFVKFFNEASPINTRRHMIELLPGIGKKHMWEVIKERETKPFESFDDIRKRVRLMPDPEKAVVKRILKEISEEDKHRLFTG